MSVMEAVNRRLLAAIQAVRPLVAYENYVADSYEALEAGKNIVQMNGQKDSYDERSDMDSYQFSTAEVSATLALAEQQRIANLLTVALDSHSPVGGGRFNFAAREQARDEALAALGLPTGAPPR